MKIHKLVVAAMLALGTVGLSLPATAPAAVGLDIDIAPPAPRDEPPPVPRAGYVWAPGYWEWRGHRHVWVQGHWVRERRGFHWVPAHWDQRGRHWRFVPGHWRR
ncbi:MAG TPA: YXWGXW repeat-containing protein [Steroidobacteraceae bacterium]|jgi:hypothetical protein